MADKTITRVGVYGTLKNGYRLHHYLEGCKQDGVIYLADCVMIHLGEYPGLVKINEDFPYKPTARVAMEVYTITPDVLEKLDRAEGHPSLFKREEVTTASFGKIYVYFKGDPDIFLTGERRIISDGKWQGLSTPYVKVNFFDGKQKPHIRAGRYYLSKIPGGGLEEVQATDGIIRPPGSTVPTFTSVVPDFLKWDPARLGYFDADGKEYKKNYETGKYDPLPPPPEPAAPCVINVRKSPQLKGPSPKVLDL